MRYRIEVEAKDAPKRLDGRLYAGSIGTERDGVVYASEDGLTLVLITWAALRRSLEDAIHTPSRYLV